MHRQLKVLDLKTKKSEALFNELNAMRKTLSKSTTLAMLDKGGKIKYVNSYFCDRSGFTKEELLGRDHQVANSGCYSAEFWDDIFSDVAKGNIWKGEITSKVFDMETPKIYL